MSNKNVKIWEEKISIPTYGIGKPDKNPMFFEKRIYQGSSGVVYPNPVIEKVMDEKTDQLYIGLFLENEYLKIMILPELGGRIQMAYDKIKERHFIYYNQVIKPALVGLTGPWISGGIEFNWPQHHRPSTFEPIDYKLEANEDGSKTIWVNEIERMFGTKGMAGFTLHPEKAYLEINVQLYNRTPLPQTFLWWANPAVKVNDYYQSVFPPDVNAVFDHGKRDVSLFPIAKGTYYKVDYSPGTDISRYKNIPVPTSYMAINSEFDFMGGYEHDTQAGMLHVADHHVSPGKKQWTWGNSDFGLAWDRNLTDEDGPYIELMAGVFTDNQPDFTWIMPHEEKSFAQYFLPYRELGVVKNATKDILLSTTENANEVELKIFATAHQPDLNIKFFIDEKLLFEEKATLSPLKIYQKTVFLEEELIGRKIVLIVQTADGGELIRYESAAPKTTAIPEPAKAPAAPKDVENAEQLFLIGQHLEQYRHATFDPVAYYEEALVRDPKDIRNNNALGLWHLRRGQFLKSQSYFKCAIETSTSRNPNPYDGEPYFNLGLSLFFEEQFDTAYSAFYKASWNRAMQDNAYFFLSQIDLIRKDYIKALQHINQALALNGCNGKAYCLKAMILRKLGRLADTLATCELGLKKDRFNINLIFEQFLVANLQDEREEAKQLRNKILSLSRGTVNNLVSYAIDYQHGGLHEEANALLLMIPKDLTNPMVYYHLAFNYHRLGNSKDAFENLEMAAQTSSYLCFPNRIADIKVLKFAIEGNDTDFYAPYYLGNLWYDKRQYTDALANWELSHQRNPKFPTVSRNLGMASFNKKKNFAQAIEYYEAAFALDKSDARVLMELDQLYKILRKDPVYRLAFLEENYLVAKQRDDLYLEMASLYNFLGRYQKAYEHIMNRQFHPWEGGEGKVSRQYLISLVEIAKSHIGEGDHEAAIIKLKKAQSYPHNLGEGKLFGNNENDVNYYLGICYEKMGDLKLAKSYFEKAATGNDELGAAIFYNDQDPEKLYYKGLALRKLGKETEAELLFENFVSHGKKNVNHDGSIDYFAVSLPDLLLFDRDLKMTNEIHVNYISGLGYLGLKNYNKASLYFEKVLAHDNFHFGANHYLNFLGEPTKML